MPVEPTPGDVLKTENGDATIESIDDGTVALSDGREVHMSFVTQGRQMGRMELVPNGGERDTFIRFGDIPEDERSYDASNDCYEDGVSVYGCEKVDGVFVPTGGQVLGAMLIMHRGANLVTGERVGTGADGEPIIRNVEIETELETPEGVNGFVPAGGN